MSGTRGGNAESIPSWMTAALIGDSEDRMQVWQLTSGPNWGKPLSDLRVVHTSTSIETSEGSLIFYVVTLGQHKKTNSKERCLLSTRELAAATKLQGQIEFDLLRKGADDGYYSEARRWAHLATSRSAPIPSGSMPKRKMRLMKTRASLPSGVHATD